jgi:hypothetical protein
MPIPSAFTEATDWQSLDSAIHGFGDADTVTEQDLLAALRSVEVWRERFTEPFTFEFRGEQITWRRYESLVWALGEAFRRVMLRIRQLRGGERVFDQVRSLCFDRRFGKGRESFTMLLGRYGGETQIPALIKLLADPEICGHAVYALRLLGATEAADSIRPFLDSPKTWVRKEAQKFLQRIKPVEKR